jgi:hypothetical protein
MRAWNRLLGTLLLVAFAVAPLGVAAEGYVCGFSGKRMVHTARVAACPNFTPAAAPGAAREAAFERPCCIYVGSTALPPVVTSASAQPLPDLRSAPIATPGVTATIGAPIALAGAPQYESGGPGKSPPPLTLRSPILRN